MNIQVSGQTVEYNFGHDLPIADASFMLQPNMDQGRKSISASDLVLAEERIAALAEQVFALLDAAEASHVRHLAA